MEFKVRMLRRKIARAATVLMLMGGSTVAAVPVLAAENALVDTAQPADAEAATALDVITVTAEKRAERIQDVPISITAVTGDTITNNIITNSTDIGRLAPELSGQGAPTGTGKPRWFLRGIGTNDPNTNQEGPLSIYVDEVVIGYQNLQSFPLYDLDQVEVLEGPQGTLWGKNNTGGAINFITRRPTFGKDGGYMIAGVGNYGDRNIQGAYGGGIGQSDTWAARAAIYYDKYNGWATNILNDQNGPQVSDVNARLQLLGAITPNLNVLLNWTTRDVTTGNVPTYTVGGENNIGNDVTTFTPNGTIYTGLTAAQIAAGARGYTPPYGANPNALSPFFGPTGSNESVRNNFSATVNWTIGPNTLTSISALNLSNSPTANLAAAAPLGSTLTQSETIGYDASRQFTQELRLTSPRNQKVSWLAGLYYYDLRLDSSTNTARFPVGDISQQYSRTSLDQDALSKAVFGNVKYAITDRAAISLGARETRESKDITETSVTGTGAANARFNAATWYLPGGVTLGPGATDAIVSKDDTWTNFTYDVTPEYRFSDDVLGYARVATGFRSGGYNQTINNGNIVVLNPEKLTDYEFGLKSSFLNDRLIFNSAAYYYDIKNLQLNIQRAYFNATSDSFTTSTSGSSNGNIKGLEFSVEALPTKYWHVQATLGLLRSRYTDFEYVIGTSAPQNASGNVFYRTIIIFTIKMQLTNKIPKNLNSCVIIKEVN